MAAQKLSYDFSSFTSPSFLLYTKIIWHFMDDHIKEEFGKTGVAGIYTRIIKMIFIRLQSHNFTV